MVDFHAVAIDDVRDLFGADERLAAEMRRVAAEAFPSEPGRRRPFLPLLRRPREFAVDPNRPTSDDLSILLSGGHVSPERTLPSWRLLRALLAHRAIATATVCTPSREWDGVEFELSRHGLDSHYALRRLGERQLGIPLRGVEGELNGYAKCVHVRETVAAWDAVWPLLAEEARALLQPVREVCRRAAGAGLDVVVVES